MLAALLGSWFPLTLFGVLFVGVVLPWFLVRVGTRKPRRPPPGYRADPGHADLPPAPHLPRFPQEPSP